MALLVAWIEDNVSRLNGKQLSWYKEVKEDVFSGHDHDGITGRKITDKVSNMKKHWKEVRATAELSRWGL